MPVTKTNQLIYKYQMDASIIGEVQKVSMPKKSVILSVQEQSGALTLWALHNDGVKPEDRSFIVAWTGRHFKLPTGFKFVGTVQINVLVYHVFAK